MATTPQSSQLEDARRSRRVVRFSRRFEHATIRGYVLDVGPKFFLLAAVSEGIWLDGFECFRISDVRDLGHDPYTVFTESALKKRGERRPRKPRVSLGDLGGLLWAASRAFPLITIHRERVDPDACWIGRVIGVGGGWLSLLEIDPGAKWDREPSWYRLGEITRVTFGDDYAEALHLVGGIARAGGGR